MPASEHKADIGENHKNWAALSGSSKASGSPMAKVARFQAYPAMPFFGQFHIYKYVLEQNPQQNPAPSAGATFAHLAAGPRARPPSPRPCRLGVEAFALVPTPRTQSRTHSQTSLCCWSSRSSEKRPSTKKNLLDLPFSSLVVKAVVFNFLAGILSPSHLGHLWSLGGGGQLRSL